MKKLFILFGMTGAGKSHIGRRLKEHGINYLEGDEFVTPEMKACLERGDQIEAYMIDALVENLAKTVALKMEENPHKCFVVGQALYLNKDRNHLLSIFKDKLQFILIETSKRIRYQRVAQRYRTKTSTVSLEYALKMDEKFEKPNHPHVTIDNSEKDSSLVIEQLQKIMPEAFKGALEKEETTLSPPLASV